MAPLPGCLARRLALLRTLPHRPRQAVFHTLLSRAAGGVLDQHYAEESMLYSSYYSS